MGCACIKKDVVVKNNKRQASDIGRGDRIILQESERNDNVHNPSRNDQQVKYMPINNIIIQNNYHEGGPRPSNEQIDRKGSQGRRKSSEIARKGDKNSVKLIEVIDNNNQNNLQNLNDVVDQIMNNNLQGNNFNSNPQIRNNQGSRLSQNIQNMQNMQNIQNNNNLPLGFEPYLQSKHDENFNFPELDHFIGKGLKRMHAYVSPVNKDDLERKKKEFWSSRTEGNQQIWQFLENICSSPDIEEDFIKEYLNAAGVSPYCDCINITYDNQGFIYEIPNYCINEPFEYQIAETVTKSKPREKIISVRIRKGVEEKQLEGVSNLEQISLLKALVSTLHFNNLDSIEYEKIRLFFGGKELKEGEDIWSYLIDEGSIIQLLYTS
jgi:hypothetical protein